MGGRVGSMGEGEVGGASGEKKKWKREGSRDREIERK